MSETKFLFEKLYLLVETLKSRAKFIECMNIITKKFDTNIDECLKILIKANDNYKIISSFFPKNDNFQWHSISPDTLRIKFFDDILKIYNFDFFDDPSMIDFLKDILKNFEGAKNMKLIVFARDATYRNSEPADIQNSSAKSIRESLIYRYPVYMGKPMKDMYNAKRVEAILGYNPNDIGGKYPIKDSEYAIVGPAILHPSVEKLLNQKEIWICHVWGPNLESRKTLDYKKYVTYDVALLTPEYERRTQRAFKLICESAKNIKSTIIRMPAIGLGSFLRECPEEDRKEAMDIFFMAAFTQSNKYNIRIDICILDTTIYATAQNHPGSLIRYLKEDLFDLTGYPIELRKFLLLVNAWDPMSFIGNGGSMDSTIDGFLVSGASYGKKLMNSSFLHNVFFSTSLLDINNWIIIR